MRTDELRWVLLRTFYQSLRTFRALYSEYERRVLEFSDRYGVDRTELKLPQDELGSLLDAQALVEFRDRELAKLRDVSHRLFRGAYMPDPFDSHVTNIYHEVSILKEEHWAIGDPSMQMSQEEYDRYYREVNVYYPRRLRHVRNLYRNARERLELLLPSMARTKVIVRSVYLFGDRLVRGVYRDGIEEFYRHMYPEGGALTGYTLAADSFFDGAFFEESAEAYDKALDALAARMDGIEGDGNRAVAEREKLEAQRTSLDGRRARALELA